MPDLLKKYRKMRDFSDTPEPAGGKPKKGKLPIFVIQKHRASHLHYDFRLEMKGVLKSWAVPKGPSYDPGTKRLAMMTEDHPYDYASFEGVIPEGNYGAGNVIIWDNGQWELIEPGDDPVAALSSGKLTFRMYGKKMFGEWALVRIQGRGKSDRGNEWLLLKHRDEYANEEVDVTEVAPRSVISNKLVDEVGGGKVWKSNRKAAPRKAPTLADELSGRRVVADKSSSRPVVKSTRKTAPKKPLDDSKKKTASKKAPSRAASARSRSSRAAGTKKARTTARRRLR
ncbi:MAG: DNA polymerase ligase N-terminal domain-containing protein [Thermoanaerobaculia bacterium]